MSIGLSKSVLKKSIIASLSIILGGVCLTLLYKNSAKTTKPSHPFTIVATTGFIGDAVRQIVQDQAKVVVLMGAGVDPHAYEATVGDGKKLARANVVFYNGLHLEGPMHEIFQVLARNQSVYVVSDALDPEEVLQDPHFSAGHDPHIWFCVLRWKKVVQYISDRIIDNDPSHASFYQQNTVAYLRELDALHRHIQSEIARVPPAQRVLVTAHDAFEYFGKTYGLQVKGLQGISTVAEPGVKDREDLKDFIIEHQIPTIFTEASVNTKKIQAVLESCHNQGYWVVEYGVLYSDSLGEADTPEATYIGMFKHNIALIVKGLTRHENKQTTIRTRSA